MRPEKVPQELNGRASWRERREGEGMVAGVHTLVGLLELGLARKVGHYGGIELVVLFASNKVQWGY